MTRSARTGLAVLLAFVGYRILVEFMALPSAVLVGMLIGGATWLATGIRAAPQPVDPDEDDEG